MNIKLLFIFTVIILLFVVGLKVMPIVYKGYITLPSLCREGADAYKRYGAQYVRGDLDHRLNELGVPKRKRGLYIETDEENVYLTLTYQDTADLYGQYQREFYFEHTCVGKRSSVDYRK